MIRVSVPLIADEEKSAVLSVLESGMLAQGTRVRQFEEAFADYCGAAHAVATSSGSTALHVALLAHGIGPGDEVITSAFGFVASANAILHVGARPVFADIDPDTFNLDPERTEQCITSRTKAIIPVDLFGHPAEMDAFALMAERHGLALVEDACQAHGADYEGRRLGSFGTACFSFYPTKNMTSAEGGMVTTDDPDISDSVRLLRDHGMRRRYHHESLGFNFRMTDVHAAIGLAQLRKLEGFNESRAANAGALTARLGDVVKCPTVRAGARHVFHQYTVRIEAGRDRVRDHLARRGVDSAIHYPLPIPGQALYRELGFATESYPETEAACDQVLSLPVHPGVSRAELDTVIEAVRAGVATVGSARGETPNPT